MLVVWNMTFIFPYIGNVIIPNDFHIFQRDWNHQPADFVFFFRFLGGSPKIRGSRTLQVYSRVGMFLWKSSWRVCLEKRSSKRHMYIYIYTPFRSGYFLDISKITWILYSARKLNGSYFLTIFGTIRLCPTLADFVDVPRNHSWPCYDGMISPWHDPDCSYLSIPSCPK